jgi:tRNA(Met) C34 N-acetyltransferase TmcA
MFRELFRALFRAAGRPVPQENAMSKETGCAPCKESDCPSKARRSEGSQDQFLERQATNRRMCQIEHKVLVLSGKGGVGKSTVAVNLGIPPSPGHLAEVIETAKSGGVKFILAEPFYEKKGPQFVSEYWTERPMATKPSALSSARFCSSLGPWS